MLATMARPMSFENEGLLDGSVISDELLQPWAVDRRHAGIEQMETFFDLESRSSLYSMSLARASNYTVTSGTGTNSTITNFIYNPATFLLSRSTSAATEMTRGATAAALASPSTGSVQYHNWLQPQHRLRSRQPKKKPDLDPLEPEDDEDDDLDIAGDGETDDGDEIRAAKLAALLGEYEYFQQSLSRPSSSSKSQEQFVDGSRAAPDATTTTTTQIAFEDKDLPPLPPMSREEFEALPPTIQRKYFSTLERLRFSQHSSLNPTAYVATDELSEPIPTAPAAASRPVYNSRFHTDSAIVKDSQGRIKHQLVDVTEQAFYNSLPDKIKRRHLNEEEQLAAHFHHQALLLDAADEALRQVAKRPSRKALQSTPDPVDDAAPSEHYLLDMPMPSTEEQTLRGTDGKQAADSLYDSFRWLEEDDDLDLRLFLDDYHINLREEMPRPTKSRRPSFRRHLSISKLPFGRSSVSFHNSRPGTKDTVTSPTSTGPFPTHVPVTSNHLRKKSRALSLISPNKQPLPDTSAVFDPSAVHYRDPEARAKLRTYLGSPQNFDEAIEFGFPSADEDGLARTLKRAESRQGFLGEWDHELGTFLEDDDKSSVLSDDVTATEPESPKTPPEMVERPVPMRPVRLSSEPVVSTRGDYAQSSATAREMTLRMTLTRPDLRANEENLYGWQKQTVRKSIMREGAVSPVIFTREISNPKESIERQFAMMDQEHLIHDNGKVKRFWNRVRRS